MLLGPLASGSVPYGVHLERGCAALLCLVCLLLFDDAKLSLLLHAGKYMQGNVSMSALRCPAICHCLHV